jgi:hypothetical protein
MNEIRRISLTLGVIESFKGFLKEEVFYAV